MDFWILGGVLRKYEGKDRQVVIPANVTRIGEKAFEGSDLTSIIIPEGVTSIGEGAFNGCRSLTSATIPESVTNIGEGAFGWCGNLSSIAIPKGVTSIGKSVFEWCDSLSSIAIPEGVTSIGDRAFLSCCGLTSITIPKTVTKIGDLAFMNCSGLTSLTIPETVNSIGGGAFKHCSSMTSITISGKVKIPLSEWNEGIDFSGCTNLTKIVLPDALKEKASICSFKGCKSLRGISLPEGIDHILPEAFLECAELREITLPSTVKEIHERAFAGCKNLREITLPEGARTLCDGAFEDCAELWEITLPSSLGRVGSCAFAGCSQLRKVVVKGGLKHFETTAFRQCPELREVCFADDSITEDREKDAKRVFGAEAKLLSLNGTPVEAKARAQSAHDQEISKKIAKVAKSKQLSQWAEKMSISANDVKYANSGEVAPGEAVLSILYAYMRQLTKLPGYHANTYKKEILPFKLVPEADAVAEMLDSESLRNAIAGLTAVDKLSSLAEEEGYDYERWIGEWDTALNNVAIILPYCRYAGEEEIQEVIAIAGNLQKQWCERGREGRQASIVYRSAVLLSDTKAAIDFAKKSGNLELYAQMRGTTLDALSKSAARKSGSKAKTGLNSSGSMGFDL